MKEFILCFINGTPGLGHAKAIAHYKMKDYEECNIALKASTRSAGVLLAAYLGMLLGGPLGPMALGLLGGITMDLITSLIESFVTREIRPNGIFLELYNLKKDEKDAGKLFDIAFALTLDALLSFNFADSL